MSIVFNPLTGKFDFVGTAVGGSGTDTKVETRTISAGEETAKQLTLSALPVNSTDIVLAIRGAGTQTQGSDYTVSGATISWNGTALDGILVEGDEVYIQYNI